MNGPANGRSAAAGSRRIVLWRHGRTVYNTENRFQGQLDPPLDDVGRRQARVAARALAALRPTMLVSSDLARAAQTAAELARVAGLSAGYDRRLREYDIGPWQGLTRHEIAERFPEEYEAWLDGVYPAAWESTSDLAARASSCVEEALESLAAGGVLVVVSHGGALRAVVGGLLRLDQSSWSRLAELGNCHWSVLAEGNRGWTLVEHNACAYETTDSRSGDSQPARACTTSRPWTAQEAEVR